MKLAAHGNCDAEELNKDAFIKAIELLHVDRGLDFEDVTYFLQEHDCDASVVFGCEVTKDTHEAFAAYLCYCLD